MKTKLIALIFIIFGFLLGILFTGITLNYSASRMLIKEMKSPYDFEKTIITIQNKINQQPGWHVVAIIDQNKKIQNHGGKAVGKFHIIQYCNGKYSSMMLMPDNRKMMGALLPKNLAIYEKNNGHVYVATSNGAVMGKLFGGETEKIIEEVSLDVEAILNFMNFKFNLF